MSLVSKFTELATDIRFGIRRLKRPARSQSQLHEFWKDPEEGNRPRSYLLPEAAVRSRYLVDLIQQAVGGNREAALLEVGCNVGRNLNFLHEAGFTNLAAIEINGDAISLMRETFPDMAADLTVHQGTAEEHLPRLADGAFDLVYTMAVLEHIHDDGAAVFGEIARVARRHLITIEDEHKVSWRHFPRNYQKIFEGLGFEQVHEQRCNPQVHGLTSVHVARVFERAPLC